jgi:transposase
VSFWNLPSGRNWRASSSGGKASAHRQRHARILLKADEDSPGRALTDQQIAEALEVGVRSVERVRRIFVEQGLQAALEPKKRERVYERKLDGPSEARLIAMACGRPPEGRARWTLRLLADALVELEIVEAISHEAVRQTLKKTKSNPGSKSSGV